MNKKIAVSVILLFIAIYLPAQKIIKGRIVDKTGHQPVAFATLHTNIGNKTILSDIQGLFAVQISSDTCTLTVSCFSFQPREISVDAPDSFMNIELAHSSMNLKEITLATNTNSNNTLHNISCIDINLRPLNSSQDLMRLVPGLFLGEHHGGGIAEHIFFRGFDADHGTDVSVSVDGMPVNLVSQIHGQGFADLHFLIPELVSNYAFGKGPYYADHGDFTTAGYVAFQTQNTLDKNVVKLEGGQFNTGRILTMLNLLNARARQNGQTAYIAGEVAYTDGPFDFKQHFSRINLFGKFITNLSVKTKLTFTASTFTSKWRSSGEIPSRAVDSGWISRFGYVDSLQGGNTSRTNLVAKLNSILSDRSTFQNQVYYTHYHFNHHYDDTFFADDSSNGDMLKQSESRDIIGYDGKYIYKTTLASDISLVSTAGIGCQYNIIYNSELSHITPNGELIEALQSGNIDEAISGAYIDENLSKGRWLFNAGARADYLYFKYADKLNMTVSNRNKTIISPKLNIEYTLNPSFQVYIKTGKGFHSNDARVVIYNEGKTILPAVYGSDLGINWKPLPKLFMNAALWYLYLQQEFVYNGDEGTVGPGNKTKREGLDLSARYQFNQWLFTNLDLNFSRSRDMEGHAGNNYLPLAVPFSSTGGLYFRFKNGLNGGLGYRYMADRPANEANSLTAKGYFVTDLTANCTKQHYELGLEIQNLFNTKWREEQFEVNSMLKNEPAPVDGINFTAGTPFFIKLKFAVFF